MEKLAKRRSIMADQDAKNKLEESVTVSQVDLSAISYSADVVGDTQEESALFRQLNESSAANESALDYSADEGKETEELTEPLTDEGTLVVDVKDGEALGIVVAPVDAPLALRSVCNGLRVLTCKTSSGGFRPQDVIVAVNHMSVTKMTTDNALTVMKTATDRKIKVLRQKALETTTTTTTTDEENITNAREGEGKEEDDEENGSVHSQWKRFKRRYAKRIYDNNRQPSIYVAGSEVKVNRDRATAPTMEPFKAYVPGGRRCENKEVYTSVLGDMTRRSKKRNLSP